MADMRGSRPAPDLPGTHSYSNDGTVRLWNTETHQQIGDPLINERADSPALAVAFAPGGEKLAAGYGGRDGLIWNIGNQRIAGTISNDTGSPVDITYSHAGYGIAAADDKNVRIWDATTYQQLRDLKGHSNSVIAVAFSSDDATWPAPRATARSGSGIPPPARSSSN
jgi:WD40 repeat protein